MANNNLFNGLEMWQAATKAYTEMLVTSTRQNMDYAFALRQQYDEMALDLVKKSQALYAREQEIALEAAETLYTQTQNAAERVSKLVETPSKK